MDVLWGPTTAFLAIIAALYLVHEHCTKRFSLFLGPKPFPFVGNPSYFLSKEYWIKLAELRKAYGPIASLQLLGKPLIVINTAAAARELVEAKSTNYSNRPLMKMVELSGFDKGVVLEHDPSRLRQARRILHHALHPDRMSSWREAQYTHIMALLRNLLKEPQNAEEHIRNFTSSFYIEVSHGYDARSKPDGYLKRASLFGEHFADVTLPNHAVNWIPWLARFPVWFPGMDFMKNAQRYRRHYISMAQEGLNMVKSDISQGTARYSLTHSALVDHERQKVADDIIMFTTAQAYTGGSDTTASLLSSFMIYMVLFPGVQSQAQDEIDRAVGPNRLPDLSDRKDLPFTEGVMAEIVRLRAPINTFYREAAEDDVHEGHHIAKGTTLLMNFWGMLHDENVYPDPHAFKPERWVGKARDPNVHPLSIVFGFGRRICPGRLIADETLFLSIARILATFNMSNALDSNGQPIQPSLEMTGGGTTRPVSLECMISPRSLRAHELVSE